MAVVKESFAKQFELDTASFYFVYKKKEVKNSDTAYSLEMKENDSVSVKMITPQCGKWLDFRTFGNLGFGTVVLLVNRIVIDR